MTWSDIKTAILLFGLAYLAKNISALIETLHYVYSFGGLLETISSVILIAIFLFYILLNLWLIVSLLEGLFLQFLLGFTAFILAVIIPSIGPDRELWKFFVKKDVYAQEVKEHASQAPKVVIVDQASTDDLTNDGTSWIIYDETGEIKLDPSKRSPRWKQNIPEQLGFVLDEARRCRNSVRHLESDFYLLSVKCSI